MWLFLEHSWDERIQNTQTLFFEPVSRELGKRERKEGRKAAGLMHYCRRLQGAWAVTQVFTRNESWFPALVDSLANIGYHQHFTTERETNFAPSSHKKVVSSFTLFEDTGLRHLAPDKYINPRDPLTQAAGRTTAPVKMRVQMKEGSLPLPKPGASISQFVSLSLALELFHPRRRYGVVSWVFCFVLFWFFFWRKGLH